jgi:uncharacterized protein
MCGDRRSSPTIFCGSFPTRPPSAIRRGSRGGRLSSVTSPGSWDLTVYPFADPEAAVAEVKAEALIKPTGRMYRQAYVVFLRAASGKIAFLREYFDPTRAAKAMDTPILGLES